MLNRILTLAVFAVLMASSGRASQESGKNPLLDHDLVNADRKTVGGETVRSAELIGIYFSAHWCPPCRAFTPRLVDFYEQVKEDGQSFEVVFVSGDRSKADMFDYMTSAEMPWPALPHTEARALFRSYRVQGIPALIVLDREGNIVTRKGRQHVIESKEDAFAGWKRRAVRD